MQRAEGLTRGEKEKERENGSFSFFMHMPMQRKRLTNGRNSTKIEKCI